MPDQGLQSNRRWSWLQFGFGWAGGLSALAVVACGCSSDEEPSCPESLDVYCADHDCPQSPSVALLDPCEGHHLMVYVEGDAAVVGLHSGYGGISYHYQKGQLVGVQSFSDTLNDQSCKRAGTESIEVERLGYSHSQGDSDLHCFGEDQSKCLRACTFCPTFADISVPMCDPSVQSKLTVR